MRKITASLLGGLALAAASPVFAQDYDYDDDPDTKPWPSLEFTGPTIELQAGWNHFTGKSSKSTDDTAFLTPSGSGIAYGGGVGYDFALGPRLTLGIEAALASTSAKWSADAIPANFNLTRVRAGHDFSFGPRLGFAFTKKTLGYVKLGYATTHYGVTAAYPSEQLSDSFSSTGLLAGAGIEEKVTKLVFVRLEFNYWDNKSAKYNFKGETPDASTFYLSSRRQQVLGSVGLRF